MAVKGIDVSAYQSADFPTSGLAFVIVKATEGTGYVNPRHAAQVTRARAAGLESRVVACSAPGCDNGGKIVRGWCNKHYLRWRNTGSLEPPTVEERFWAKVQPTGFCWEWIASLKPNGYGQFSPRPGRVAYAHRYAYELLVGPIPTGADLDHLCRNRRCVNPDHLDPVDRRTNLLRSPITLSGAALRRKAAA